MENNIIYWPSGWKDLTCPKKLPIVREEQVSAPPPVVSSAGTQRSAEELPTVDNTEMTNKRNQLRRQRRVARGLGEDLPPALPVLNTGPSFLAALSQNTQEMDISDSDNSKITVINRDDRFKETQIIVDNFPQLRKKSSSDNKRFQTDATRSENPPVDVHYSKTVATEKRLLELPLNREINSPSPSKVDITLRYMPLLKITEERPSTNQEIAVRRPLNNRTVRSSNTVNKHIYLPVEMPQNTNKMKELNYFDANVQNERSNSKNAFSMKKSKTPDISNEDRIVVSVLELSPFENIEGQDTNSKMDVDTDEQVNKQQATDVSHTQNFAKPTLHKQFEAIRAKSKARTLLLNVLPSFHKTVSKDSAKEISSEDLFLRPERKISSGIRFPSVEKSQPMELIKESKSKRSYDRNIIQPVTKIHPRLKLDSTFVISRQKTYLVLKERSHKIKDKPFGHISPRGMVKNDSPGKQMMIYKKASAVPTKRTDYVFPSDLNVEAGSNQVISHNESYIKEWSTEVLAINDTPRRRQSVASTSNQKSSHSTKLPLLNSSQSRQTNVSEKDPIEPLSIISTEIKPNSASDKRRAFNTEKDKPHEVKQQHRKKQISKLKPRRQHSFYLSEFQNNKNNVRSKQRKGKRRSIDYTSPNGSVSENTLVVQYGDKQHDENDFQAISKEEESLLFELSTVNHRDTSEVVRSESSTEPSTDSLLVDETSDQNMVTLRDVLSGIVDEKPKTECLPGLTSQTDQTDNNKRGSSNSECSLMLDDLMTKDIKRTGNFKSEDIENSDDFITDDILDKMANCNSMNFSENTLDPSSSSADRCHKQDNKTISNTSRLYEQTPSGKTTNSVIDFLHEQSDSADLDSSNTDHEDMDTDTPLNRINNNITSSNEHSMNGTVGGKRAQTDDSSSPIYETDENFHKANADVDNSYSDHEDMDTNTSLNNRSNSNITSSNEHRTNETVASKRSKTDDSSPINETDENVNKAHTDVDSSNSDHEDMDTSTTLNNYSNKNITSTNGTADDKRSKTDDSSSPINETDEMVHKAHTDVDSSNSDHEDMDTDTSLNNRSNKNITSTNEHSTTGTDDSSSPINKTDENIHTAHTDVKKIQTGVHDEEITAKPNTSPNTDTNHKQIHENPSDLKAVTNNNVDRDEVQLSLNSTTNLTSETIQIIQNTINEYGIDNASASSSFNKEDSQENDAKIMESTDSEMLDQTPTIEKTSDNELTNLTPNGTTGERVEHNAENDEDYMDSSALAANYVPYSLVRDATSSASLPGSPLEDEQDIIATISNMIQVSVCKPEVKISKPKPRAIPPVKSHIFHTPKRRPKPLAHVKPTPRTSFPPIKLKQNSVDLKEHPAKGELQTEERPPQARTWTKAKPQRFRLPSLQAHAEAAMSSGLAAQAREDISKVATNIEEMNFKSEQYQERLATYDHKGFVQPRVVLVSSKVPRCNSMKRAIRKENNVMFIVYDFDKWSFSDILDAVSDRLNSYHSGCKAHSVLLLCQGGNGYAYLLKNFVLTPQKLKRVDYKPLREFWFNLGALVSKIKPEESVIYIVGCVLDIDKQGRDLLTALRKLIYPLRVQIESPQEGTEQGKTALRQYFHYRRFLLWRSFIDGSGHPVEQGPLRRPETTINYTMIYYIATMAIALWSMSLGY